MPYNRRGVRPVPTASSVPVSSSRYLNSVRMRDWAATQFLRRNGPGMSLDDDLAALDVALAEVRDHARIEALIAAAARYVQAVRTGLTPRSAFPPDWAQRPPVYDAGGELARALAENRVEAWRAAAPPPAPAYRQLQAALAHAQADARQRCERDRRRSQCAGRRRLHHLPGDRSRQLFLRDLFRGFACRG